MATSARRAALLLLLALAACTPPGPSTPDAGAPDAGSSFPPLDLQRSSFVVDRTTGIVADGLDRLVATITLRGTDGTPLADAVVEVGVQLPDDSVEPILSEHTDVDGVLRVWISSQQAGSVVFRASVVLPTGKQLLPESIRVTFIPPPVATLALVRTPTQAVAGAPLEGAVVVEARDGRGALATTATFATLSLAPGSTASGLEGTLVAPFVLGVARFTDLRILGLGQARLHVDADGLSVEGAAFEVAPGALASLTFAVSPPDHFAGGEPSATPELEARNAYGVLIPVDPSQVVLTLEGPGQRRGCLQRAVGAWWNGRLRYQNVRFPCAGAGVRLTATLPGTSVPPATSDSFTVRAGAPHESTTTLRVSFSVAPADGMTPVQLILDARDWMGNPLPDLAASFAGGGTGRTLTVAGAQTNAAGRLIATLKSTVQGPATVSASVGERTFFADLRFADVSSPGACRAATWLPGPPLGDLQDVRAPLLADLDGDERADLLNGSWLQFGHRDGLPVSGLLQDVSFNGRERQAVDVDVDGVLDVVQLGSSIDVAYNRGDGALLPPLPVALFGGEHLLVEDVDADGRPDVGAVVQRTDGSRVLRVALQREDGTFSSPVETALAFTPVDMVVGRQGQAGTVVVVAVAREAPAVHVLRAQGGGLFVADAPIPLSGAPRALARGDLDGDGHLDVVVSDMLAPRLTMLRGRSDGGLEAPEERALEGAARQLLLADLDGDGRQDMLAVVGEALWVLRHEGTGQPLPSVRVPLLSGQGTLLAGDVTGDGRVDLLLLEPQRLTSLPNLGSGAVASVEVLSGAQQVRSLATGDLDADGRPDVALVAGKEVRLRMNPASGRLLEEMLALPAQAVPEQVVVADVVGDAHADVLVADSFGAQVHVFRGTGVGGLVAAGSVSVQGSPLGLAVGNLDADAAPEVLVRLAGGAVQLLDADAGGQLTPSGTSAVRARDLALADMDGDADLDLVVVDDAEMLRLYRHTGAGAFSLLAEHRPFTSPRSLAVGDVDGDGHADVAVVEPSGWVELYVTGGDSTLSRDTSQSMWGSPGSAVLADVTGDGRLDLVVGNTYQGRTSLFPGLGGGKFGGEVRLTLPSGGQVTAADWDGDGRLDLIGAGAGVLLARNRCTL